MNRSILKSRIILIITYLFVVLFVYGGVRKMLDVETFMLQIGETLQFKSSAAAIAWSLIILQLLAGALLLLQPTRRLGLYLSFILMTLFTLYLLLILNFSTYVPCACSGVFPGISWHTHLYVNVALTFIAFVGLILERKHTSIYLKHTT